MSGKGKLASIEDKEMSNENIFSEHTKGMLTAFAIEEHYIKSMSNLLNKSEEEIKNELITIKQLKQREISSKYSSTK